MNGKSFEDKIKEEAKKRYPYRGSESERDAFVSGVKWVQNEIAQVLLDFPIIVKK